MKIFLFVYLAMVLVHVIAVAIVDIKKPKYFENCDHRLRPNIVAFFLWPIVWIRAIDEHISRNG